jgi:hypothetical protein
MALSLQSSVGSGCSTFAAEVHGNANDCGGTTDRVHGFFIAVAIAEDVDEGDKDNADEEDDDDEEEEENLSTPRFKPVG